MLVNGLWFVRQIESLSASRTTIRCSVKTGECPRPAQSERADILRARGILESVLGCRSVKELLTIGELARQSGVHVKSLRYYGELGILPPTHVDSATGYRYYEPSQVMVVEAIRFCVLVGIPLARLHEYLSADGKRVLYGKLMDDGCVIAERKIRDIRSTLRTLREARADMERIEGYADADAFVDFVMPARHYWIVPFEGVHRGAAFNETVNEVFRLMESLGITIGFEAGLMLRCAPDGKKERFLMVEVRPSKAQLRKHPSITCLPAGRYRCCQMPSSRIDDAAAVFPELSPELVLEIEFFPETGEPMVAQYELRCLLPSSAS